MAENQVSFKKKYKRTIMGITAVIYFADFPILYNGVCNDNMGMMIAGMVIVGIGMVLDIIFS